ncbi:unnamed protein product, partial [Nesidiocoris tenuis]
MSVIMGIPLFTFHVALGQLLGTGTMDMWKISPIFQSWSVAMTEAFYTWGLLGASAMQMASHNRPHHLLYKDTNIVTAVTFAVLILSAFLANTCSQLLLAHGYQYTPSSFEKASTYGFLQPVRWSPLGTNGQPVKWMTHNLYLAGDRIVKPGTNTRQQSGYQAL